MDVEQPARPATADELGKHPAAAFGAKATAAGWAVDYRTARGPLTVKRRPAEPNEHGKYALVEATDLVDTVGVRAAHPDGRRIAAWWVGRTFGEGWAASPRRNARQLGIRALTSYLTETEEENVSETTNKVPPSMVETWATEHLADGALMDNIDDVGDAYVAGFGDGHAQATANAADAYGEGYAAGVAAVAGHTQVWVKTRRRLDALRPGDELLGKDGRSKFVVETSEAAGREWEVTAWRGGKKVVVQGDAKRLVDVVEPIALADALEALKAGGIVPARADEAVNA